MRYPQSVTIVHRAAGARDDYGNQPLTETGREQSPAEVQQASRDELGDDRDTRITQWNVFLPPDVQVEATALVLWSGRTLEVLGDPELLLHPWNGRADHWELRMVEATA